MHSCLFLDRDGIINQDHGYVHRPEDCDFCPGIFELCCYFQNLGFKIIVVTNQSGIARGYYPIECFNKLTNHINNIFSEHGIHINATYFCPHGPDDNCNCRKPKPGMLLQAQQEHLINMERSLMIGDKKSDMQAAHAAKVKHLFWLTQESISYANSHNISHLAQVKRIHAATIATV